MSRIGSGVRYIYALKHDPGLRGLGRGRKTGAEGGLRWVFDL